MARTTSITSVSTAMTQLLSPQGGSPTPKLQRRNLEDMVEVLVREAEDLGINFSEVVKAAQENLRREREAHDAQPEGEAALT